MKIHIFTIAHNAMPFITRHLSEFAKIKHHEWFWHICEGPAAFVNDSFRAGGRLTLGRPDGGSSDGTAEYLDGFCMAKNIKVSRKPLWHGKTEMVNHAIGGVEAGSLVLEVDCDEMWTGEQITRMADLFEKNPHKLAAWFYCRYFVGPDLMMSGINCLGNHTEYEWVRAWRWIPGATFSRHEPPYVTVPGIPDIAKAPGQVFSHRETEAEGLVFNHYSWVTPEQVKFKETYYGYAGTFDGWTRLQKAVPPVQINSFIPHLGHGMVVRAPAEHRFR